MHNKIIRLESHFPQTGEATVQPVVLWANNRPCVESITKHASVGSDFFKNIKPVPGQSIVYVLAVSAWERYGENRNGDGFPEFPYKEHLSPPAIAPEDTLVQHYKSFETHGHNYRHHQNKDPKKAVGKVMKAFWNPTMHRVELLISLDDSKAPDLAERIAAGEFPPVSMGTKVPYDVCTICLNRAPTRAQYCNHLKFQMRDVINGVKVAALNPRPKFFDISWVYRPADPIAYMLKKVAEETPYTLISGSEAGEYLDDMQERKLAAHKLAVIDKVVQGLPVDAKTEGVDEADLNNIKKMRVVVIAAGKRTPTFPDSILRQLATLPMNKTLSSLYGSGMALSTPEITKIVVYKSMPSAQLSNRVLGNCVGMQRSILELFEDHPQILDTFDKSAALDIGVDHIDSAVTDLVSSYVEKRAGISEYLKRRLVPESHRNETPYTTPLSLTDPGTGYQYGTTRGAAIRAHDEIAKRNLYKVLGGGALLGGAYKLLSSGLRSTGYGKLRPLAGLSLAALGAYHWPGMGEHYMTDQGIPIPTNTELAKVGGLNPAALALPLFGTLGTMALMAHDYNSRIQDGVPLGHPYLPFSRRALDTSESFAQEHPLITAGLGTAALFALGKTKPFQVLGKTILPGAASAARRGGSVVKNKAQDIMRSLAGGETKLSSYVGDLIPRNTDTVLLPEIDMDKLAERIGKIIVEG